MNEQLRDLYSSPNIIQVIKSIRMKWAGHVTRVGKRKVAYGILVGKSEEKRPLGWRSHRWKDDIKMGLKELGWESMDWVDMAQDRERRWALVNAVMNLRVP